MLNRGEDLRPLKLRFQLMLVIIAATFVTLAGRLFQLQVLEETVLSTSAAQLRPDHRRGRLAVESSTPRGDPSRSIAPRIRSW